MWGGGPWSGAGIVVGLVVLALLAGAVVLIGVAARTGGGRWSPSRDRAAELLAERFARGEIDEQEYEHRLAVLDQHRGVG